MPAEHLQQDHAQAVDVAACVQRLTLRLLGAAVGRAADGDAGLGQFAVELQLLGHAKVAEHGGAIVAKEDVAGLDVAVHQALVVYQCQGAGDLPDDAQRTRRLQALPLVLGQITASQVLHGEKMAAVVQLVDAVDGDDRRMLQGGDCMAFLDEALGEGCVLAVQQHLERHLALQRLLGSQIDLGHAAFAQAVMNAVTGYADGRLTHAARLALRVEGI